MQCWEQQIHTKQSMQQKREWHQEVMHAQGHMQGSWDQKRGYSQITRVPRPTLTNRSAILQSVRAPGWIKGRRLYSNVYNRKSKNSNCMGHTGGKTSRLVMLIITATKCLKRCNLRKGKKVVRIRLGWRTYAGRSTRKLTGYIHRQEAEMNVHTRLASYFSFSLGPQPMG